MIIHCCAYKKINKNKFKKIAFAYQGRTITHKPVKMVVYARMRVSQFNAPVA
jgi:hypothetical protein